MCLRMEHTNLRWAGRRASRRSVGRQRSASWTREGPLLPTFHMELFNHIQLYIIINHYSKPSQNCQRITLHDISTHDLIIKMLGGTWGTLYSKLTRNLEELMHDPTGGRTSRRAPASRRHRDPPPQSSAKFRQVPSALKIITILYYSLSIFYIIYYILYYIFLYSTLLYYPPTPLVNYGKCRVDSVGKISGRSGTIWADSGRLGPNNYGNIREPGL